VGGGFGVRGELYPEDVLVCLGALRLARPVKWIEDRHEHLVATNHSRQQRHQVRAAVDAEGFILAIDDRFLHDQGAYVRTHGARVVDLTAGMLPGPYRLPAYRAAGHYRLTNKTPAATYRSPGRYESTFVRERLLDAVAHRLGIDRVEVRRRNLIGTDDMPFARPLDALGDDVVLDSGRTMRSCSTRPSHGSNGRSSTRRWRSGVVTARPSVRASPCSSRRAGLVPPMA